MRAVVVAALLAAPGAVTSAGTADGSGSAPGVPAFDPTGSHPLPNQGVERRFEGSAPASGADGAERPGCGCRVTRAPGAVHAAFATPPEPGVLDPVAASVALASIAFRRTRRWRRNGLPGSPKAPDAISRLR